jgi:hypothetical protein
MEIGAAMLHADRLDGRSFEDWHSEQNCFVGGSHKCFCIWSGVESDLFYGQIGP